ncbi:MAG: rhomboid family intramembrane serine protease [Ktedonobacteraceae bacterium]|nr:rhomboid family intramembrane serine protease [Ktedonobacteraceae bacterium]
MEAQTDIQSYMERGKQALAEGQPREAAIAYAHAAQLDADNPAVHLGLAEANMGLNSYRVVSMACARVQELQPQGGLESQMAQILLNVLDHRYDRALLDVDTYITQDPANGYAHALRSYLLQATGQTYDAGLARARASRLTYGGRFEHCFPPLEPIAAASTTLSGQATSAPGASAPAWSPPSTIQRQAVRARFVISQNPRFVTNILIAINVVVFLITAYLSKSISDINQGVLVIAGAQADTLVAQGEFWRIFTAMFLHLSIIHIGLNMLSLFFVGTAIEMFYGKWRYLVIYLLSGIVGGITTFLLDPQHMIIAVGASGAIFGVFGALGAFYIVNRRSLGAYGQGAIFNWLFWLMLNIVWSFSIPGIAIYDHLGGLAAGLILGIVLVRRLRPRRVA